MYNTAKRRATFIWNVLKVTCLLLSLLLLLQAGTLFGRVLRADGHDQDETGETSEVGLEEVEAEDLVEEWIENPDESAFTIFMNDRTRPEPEESRTAPTGITEGYEAVAENERLRLYVNEENLGIKIENKSSGYIWDGTSDRDEGDMNQTWQGFKESAVTFDYEVDGRSGRASVTTGSARVEVNVLDQGFEAEVRLRDTGIEFLLRVTLDDNAVVVELPQAALVETKDDFRITEIFLYPFLGSTYAQDVTGYFMIPDGAGALIRFSENHMVSEPYRARFYGEDLSVFSPAASGQNLLPAYQLKWPVFGVAHGAESDAVLAIVEGGQAYGALQAYTSGITTDYNFITASFTARSRYFQATNQRGDGFNLLQQQANPLDLRLRYEILDGEDADYVGMARRYRDYLDEQGNLADLSETLKAMDGTPLLLETFMAESRQALIGSESIVMTRADDVLDMTERLSEQGVAQQEVLVSGWIRGGMRQMSLSHQNPLSAVASASSWRDTADALNQNGIDLSFRAQYFRSYDDSRAFRSVNDGAFRITEAPVALFDQSREIMTYFVSPQVSLDRYASELDTFDDLGASGLYLADLSSYLYSDYNTRQPVNREQSMEIIRDMLELGDAKKLISTPYDFLLSGVDAYLDTPTVHSGYMSFTDSVPFLQIVLAGRLPMYAEAMNFNASDESAVLRAVDYGVYPAYLVTEEDPVVLLGTDASNIYTSRFEIWEDIIVETWQRIHNVLDPVRGEAIVDRSVPEPGVSVVRYSNNNVIYVNYNEYDVTVDGYEIPAEDFLIGATP